VITDSWKPWLQLDTLFPNISASDWKHVVGHHRFGSILRCAQQIKVEAHSEQSFLYPWVSDYLDFQRYNQFPDAVQLQN
jgi:hypothetical protein